MLARAGEPQLAFSPPAAPTRLALAMRPKTQRRVIGGTIALAAVAGAAVAAVVLLGGPSKHPNAGVSAGTHRPVARSCSRDSVSSCRYGPGFESTYLTGKLVFGMTKQQVLGRVGAPERRLGSCWQYTENLKIRGGQDTLNAERVCFLGGAYSYAYSEVNGRWIYPYGPQKKLVIPPSVVIAP